MAVIGSEISGAMLLTHRIPFEGIGVIVVSRREMSPGSESTSTALSSETPKGNSPDSVRLFSFGR